MTESKTTGRAAQNLTPSSVEFLQTFLGSISPRRGIGYLLRKHPTGAYFPVFCMHNRQPVPFPQAFTPYAIEPRAYQGRLLGNKTGILELAATARLETLFLEPPVIQNVYPPADDERDPPVLLVASLPDDGSEFSIRGRAEDLAKAAGMFMRVWNDLDLYTQAGKFGACGNLECIADSFAALAGGERTAPDPPPFLSLAAAFERSGERIERHVGNALTLNCLYATDPAAVRLRLERALETRQALDSKSRLMVRTFALTTGSARDLLPAQTSSDWHLLRLGIHILREYEAAKDGIMTRIDYFDPNGNSRTLLAKPGPAPIPLDAWDGVSAEISSERPGCTVKFVTVGEAASAAVRSRLAPLVNEIGASIQLLNPLVLAQERWNRYVPLADALMSIPREGHEVRGPVAVESWRNQLPVKRRKIGDLVGDALDSVTSAFGVSRKWIFDDGGSCESEKHLPLHLLWCIRKTYVHPAMILWVTWREPSALDESLLPLFFRSAKDDELDGNEKLAFGVSLLAAVHGLFQRGGLKSLELKREENQIRLRGEVEVHEPGRWLQTTRQTAPADAGDHSTATAFAVFNRHATSVAAEINAEGNCGSFVARFPAGEIQ